VQSTNPRVREGPAGVQAASPTDTTDERALPATLLFSAYSTGLGGFAAGRFGADFCQAAF
jgi:hypothetical protein